MRNIKLKVWSNKNEKSFDNDPDKLKNPKKFTKLIFLFHKVLSLLITN